MVLDGVVEHVDNASSCVDSCMVVKAGRLLVVGLLILVILRHSSVDIYQLPSSHPFGAHDTTATQGTAFFAGKLIEV